MGGNRFRVAASALLIGVGASQAGAQRGQQASLGGTVTDETGAVLTGVQLTVRSPQLIGGPQTAESDASGVYRFRSLLQFSSSVGNSPARPTDGRCAPSEMTTLRRSPWERTRPAFR